MLKYIFLCVHGDNKDEGEDAVAGLDLLVGLLMELEVSELEQMRQELQLLFGVFLGTVKSQNYESFVENVSCRLRQT